MALTELERKRIEQLERQVSNLMRYKEDRERQQITLPLDLVSRQIINNI